MITSNLELMEEIIRELVEITEKKNIKWIKIDDETYETELKLERKAKVINQKEDPNLKKIRCFRFSIWEKGKEVKSLSSVALNNIVEKLWCTIDRTNTYEYVLLTDILNELGKKKELPIL